MNPRWITLLSVVLYAAALATPALTSASPSPNETPMFGWQCFLFGPAYFIVVWPLLCWIPNPWLFLLWLNTLRGRRTGPSGTWGAFGFSIASVAFLGMVFSYFPHVGAILWIASMAAGGFAAMENDCLA